MPVDAECATAVDEEFADPVDAECSTATDEEFGRADRDARYRA